MAAPSWLDGKPTVLDLFAGAGGLALGFRRAGFRIVGVVERDAVAAATYRRNFGDCGDPDLQLLGPERGDVSRIDFGKLAARYRGGDGRQLDVIAGGPPCQGFSRVGRGKLDSLTGETGSFRLDPRNELYRKFLDAIRAFSPAAFVFENVAGILHLRGTNFAEIVCREAEELGYEVRCGILNAVWYGVPQARERVFVIGVRRDLGVEPSFPVPQHQAHLTRGHLTGVTLSDDTFAEKRFFCRIANPKDGKRAISVEDAIGDLPPFLDHLEETGRYRSVRRLITPKKYFRKPGQNWYRQLMREWPEPLIRSEMVEDHFCRRTPRDYGTFGRMSWGDKYPNALEHAWDRYEEALEEHELSGRLGRKPRKRDFIPPYPEDDFPEKWRKLNPKSPSWTITAHLAKDCYSHIHYDPAQMRSITIREAARLQSFPDGFKFEGNMGDCFRQIGNAVPPLLAYAVAGHLRGLLFRHRDE